MSKEKLRNCFCQALGISPDLVTENLSYNTISEWDSVGHMGMIAAVEETFNITMETDDIVDLSSYTKGKEILHKYGVNVEA